MPKILFTIPTLFHNKDLVINCVNTLRANMSKFDVDYEICIVINQMTESFSLHDFGDKTTKLCSNLQFNISKALNTAALSRADYDYFCYVDEGMTIDNNIWIDYLIQLFNMNPMIGLLGCRPHSTFNSFNKKVSEDPELYEVLWSDGILFTTKQIIYELNGFDESYFGDCEMQDFGYRLHFKGYTNLYWKSLFSSHKLIDYTSKSSNPKQLIDLAWKSRKLFKDTWNDIEYKTYNFKSNPC